MFFFSNSEKSTIERQYRNTTGNLPYQLPSDLKNRIIRAAEELKDLQLRRYDKKTQILRQQEQDEKRETDTFKQHKHQIEQQFQRELDELSRQYKHKLNEISNKYSREIDSLHRADQYNEQRLQQQISTCQQDIQNWQRHKNK